MLGSMYSAVSGLSAHQTKMNVIGNNIANVNTYGFKASRVTFSDVFYQTMSGASAPTAGGGGTNPTQLGYGAKVNSIDVINTRAGSATTDRALDVYINGEGYLPVRNSDGVVRFTRIGVLSFDLAGNLVDSNGNKVLGFPLDSTTKNPQLGSDGTTTAQSLVEINVPPSEMEKYTGIAIGQNGEITAIKEGDPVFVPGSNTAWMKGAPTVAADSLYNGTATMTVTRQGTTSGAPLTLSSNADLGSGSYSLLLSADGEEYILKDNSTPTPREYKAKADNIDTSTTPNTLTFTSVDDVNGGKTATVKVPIGTSGYAPTSSTPATIGTVTPSTTYDIALTTVDKAGAQVILKDTWQPVVAPATPDETLGLGNITMNIDATKFQAALDKGFSGVNIGNVGPGPGVPIKVAHLATTKFANPDGLSQDGEGYYVETTNSGSAVATIPGSGGTGNFRSGALEMSNVDLSREFTEMIITQRGFQANTRMITVSDEMLSELVSMKR